MHKLIVCSATYRQASKARPDLATLDPRNRLLAKQSRLRLEAEEVRDAALTASGLLTPTVGGPSVGKASVHAAKTVEPLAGAACELSE